VTENFSTPRLPALERAGATPYRVAKDLGIDRHTAAKYGVLP
jgi:hypothetical protein